MENQEPLTTFRTPTMKRLPFGRDKMAKSTCRVIYKSRVFS